MDFDALLQEAEGVQAGMQPAAPRRPMQPPEELSMMDKLLAKVPAGLVNNPVVTTARGVTMGMADPAVGAAQTVANLLPNSTGVPSMVNQAISDKNASYDAERGPDAGVSVPILGKVDPARLVGNVLSPVNLAVALRSAPAVTATARAVQGATTGFLGGATAPVDVGPSEKFWGPKALQTAVGTVAGGVLNPVVGAAADKALPLLTSIRNKAASYIGGGSFDPADAAVKTDAIINDALKESGQSVETIPPSQLEGVRQQVQDALSRGKKLDAAAALRKADFDAEGIAATQGQITRDPMQFAEEQTMKAMSRPLSQTIEAGNKKVMQGIGQYGANAQEAPAAATTLADALRSYDKGQQGNITTAYATARASAGKDLEVPTQGLQDTYKQVYKTFKDSVPTAVRDEFSALGSGPFTFENADELRKIINANVKPDARDPTNAALSTLRSALNNAQKDAAAGGGPFAPAVKLAADHFAQQEAIPALGDAASGSTGDNFVSKYIINGQAADVQKLASLLREQSPEAFQEARAQIGAHLSSKAFGANVAADKPIAQESYNKALKNLGSAKLNAFFEPPEVEQLQRLGRIGAYQNSNPAAAASNFSNSAGALANLLRSGGGIPVFGKSLQYGGEKLGGYAATHPVVPATANMSDGQLLALSNLLRGLSGGAGLALGGRIEGQ